MTSATFVPGPAPTRLTRLRDLPRRGLVAGGGHVREICGHWGSGGELHWMLQLVELRRPEGVLHLPPDAAHTLAGIGGPQVGVGPGAAVGLRKERVLHYAGAFLELRRPQLRAAELSRVLVLSSVPARATPSLVFSDLHGVPALPAAPIEASHAYVANPVVYPGNALRQHLQGTVVLRVLVDETGQPLEVTVMRGSGHAELDRSAREQVLAHWRFQPAIVNGHAVRAWASVPVTFTLRG